VFDDDKFCPSENDPQLLQRYIAAVFYFATNGNMWNDCYRNDDTCGELRNDLYRGFQVRNGFNGGNAFLSAGDVCDWYGLACNMDKMIDDIDFEEENNVAGYLPEEIGHLESLKKISLESQRIGGTLPQSIGYLKSLTILDLDYNEIGGKLPESITKLRNLGQLDLNNNQFTGTLSNDIGDMSSLVYLSLHNNRFSGTFPKELVFCPLVVAEFKNNNIEGHMPLCVGAPWQTVEAITCDCATGSVTCDDGCQCQCF